MLRLFEVHPVTTSDRPRLPSQIAYIIGNEGCERFSFYGMRNILTIFLAQHLLLALPEAERAVAAKDVFHTFVIGVYFFPLLGGLIADRWLGRYKTILYLSLLYCMGHLMLALSESSPGGFYTGLFLIALGSGGIKPCVSAFVGDQFDQSTRHMAKLVFDAFYWIINFGSFFASLLIPWTLKAWGPSVAFGIPGILMAVATLIFWLGRDRYVCIPPAPRGDPHALLPVARDALSGSTSGRVAGALAVAGALLGLATIPWLGFVSGVCLGLVAFLAAAGIGTALHLDEARAHHPDDAIEGVRAVLRLLVLFALVTPFWSLFDQKASTWVLQASEMTRPEWFQPSQMQALNPALVMLFIPLNNALLYPLMRKLGLEPTALRRMTTGIALSGLSWIVAGGLQVALDQGQALSITWQVLPYALLTFGEVLVSATGLEFAYSQAPLRMKSALMAFWSLSVTVGNLWVLMADAAVKGPAVTGWVEGLGVGVTAFQMLAFAGFALAAAAAFGLYARAYPVVERYRPVEA